MSGTALAAGDTTTRPRSISKPALPRGRDIAIRVHASRVHDMIVADSVLLNTFFTEEPPAMPDVKIQQGLWKHLLSVAEKQHRKPEALANQALRDFLERMADRELLARSATAARRSPLAMADAEEAIRRHRRRK